MLYKFDTQTLVWLFLIGLVSHAAWLILSSRFHPLFLLAAVFTLIAPFSLSVEATSSLGALKVARIYLTALMVITGLFLIRHKGLGVASILFLAFVSLYVVGALWSDEPVQGLMYKGNFAMLVTAGVLMGLSLENFTDLHRALRVMLAASIVWSLLIVADIAANPLRIGRLHAYGINANGIAASSAFSMTMCLYLALYDTAKGVKVVSYAIAVVLATIIPFTGSRGGFGLAVVMCGTLFLPLVRRPLRFLLILAVVTATGYAVAAYVQPESAERLMSTENTREGIWRYSLERFAESPVIGHGWLYTHDLGRVITLNTHSIYLQTLVDVGVLGLIVMLLSLGFAGLKLLVARRAAAASIGYTAPVYLATAFYLASVGLGLVELGPLAGTTINGLFFGVAIGLIDSLPKMINAELAERHYQAESEATSAPSPQSLVGHEVGPAY